MDNRCLVETWIRSLADTQSLAIKSFWGEPLSIPGVEFLDYVNDEA